MLPLAPPPIATPTWTWDVFCRVIDNFGDIGVSWRLCRQLASAGHRVRLWVDDAQALRWMAPATATATGSPAVTVLPWSRSQDTAYVQSLPPADVWVEAFGCEIATEFIAANAEFTGAEGQFGTKEASWPVWINLEYLSAEPYARRCHRLASPVMHGPARGATKFFFYPGFTADSGSLLREPDLRARRAVFDTSAWLAGLGVHPVGGPVVSLFCYEPAALAPWLEQLSRHSPPCTLLVTPGRATAALQGLLAQAPGLAGTTRIHYLPYLSHDDFDHLLWACDLNMVRGEDSLVRALWAGKPWVWHIYPQDDNAHHAKLQAFLDWAEAPATLRAWHRAWNGIDSPAQLPSVPEALANWARCAQGARARLLALPDLCTQLVDFVLEKR